MKSKLVVGAICFVLGVGTVLAIQRWLPIHAKPGAANAGKQSSLQAMQDLDPLFHPFFGDDFFGHRIRERMMNDFDQPDPAGGVFDTWYRRRIGSGDAGEVKRREDRNFIYYDIAIKDVDKDKLKVKVENGQINISGQSEKKSEADDGRRTYVASTFHRSFPAPSEVDFDHVQIEQSGDKLILKFPRAETQS